MAASTTAHPPPPMDRRVQRLACRVAVALSAAATLSLLYLFRHASTSCFPASHSLALTISLASFPRTSCDAASRRVVHPDRRLDKLRASPRWRRRSAALAAAVFPPLRGLRLLAGSSRVLCLAAGAGNAVDALHAAGVSEVTGIDLVDFPPLVRRADPHSLPFSDGSFDHIFSDESAGISGALFPSRLAAEAERAVRRGGAIALTELPSTGTSTPPPSPCSSRGPASWIRGMSPWMVPGAPFPPNFCEVIRTIFKRLFRVYVHIYHSHFQMIVKLKEKAHLNTCFKHFTLFTWLRC